MLWKQTNLNENFITVRTAVSKLMASVTGLLVFPWQIWLGIMLLRDFEIKGSHSGKKVLEIACNFKYCHWWT